MTVEHVLLKWLPWSTERAELIKPLCTKSLRPFVMVTTKSGGRAAIWLVQLTGIQNQSRAVVEREGVDVRLQRGEGGEQGGKGNGYQIEWSDLNIP
jgi:hypothetical protein